MLSSSYSLWLLQNDLILCRRLKQMGALITRAVPTSHLFLSHETLDELSGIMTSGHTGLDWLCTCLQIRTWVPQRDYRHVDQSVSSIVTLAVARIPQRWFPENRVSALAPSFLSVLLLATYSISLRIAWSISTLRPSLPY